MPTHGPRLRRFNHLYRLVKNGGICVYCGVKATTIDHFVPNSVVAMLVGVLDDTGLGGGKFLVPACGECNSIASNHMFRTVAAKRRYIQERLKQKYRKVLEMPAWPEDEQQEMGRNMQTKIKEGLARKEWVCSRIAWRNTMNPSVVDLAKIRFAHGVYGKSSARQHAGHNGTTQYANAS